jgi:hypothetical protein
MAQTTFSVDDRTIDALEQLKGAFGVKTNAQVIRKALALARVAAEMADKKTNSVTIGSASEAGQTKILLSG